MALTQDVLSRVLIFANGKGGVGKTTTSTNFAGLCAAAGWRVLFMEFDPQGDAGTISDTSAARRTIAAPTCSRCSTRASH